MKLVEIYRDARFRARLRAVGVPVVLAAILTVGGAPAQAQEGMKIGIVDIQLVLRDSKAWKAVLPEIEKLRREFQNRVRDEERALREAEQELAQQRAILSPEVFTQKRRAFSEKASEAQRIVQERRRSLDQALNTTRTLIFENLAAVAQDVAKERNLSIVLDKKFVFLSAKSLDITPEIVSRLDKRLPSVSIKIDPNGKEKGGKK